MPRYAQRTCLRVISLVSLMLALTSTSGASQVSQTDYENYIPIVVRPVTYDESSGIPDEDFGGDGVVSSDFPVGKDNVIQGMGLQADGKVVAVGFSFNGSDDDIALARYLPDGSLDPAFDGDGWLLTDLFGGGSNEEARAMVVQKDGKILVAGYTDGGEDLDFLLVRYNPDGSLDMDFDGDGWRVSDFYGSHESANGLTLQADGKLLVAGYTYQDTDADFAIARYHPDGSLDTSFGGVGWVRLDFAGGKDMAKGVAVQADGRIVVVGEAEVGVDSADFALARFNPEGSLDATFDGDGWLLTDLEGNYDIGKALVVQPEGKIVVSGDSSGDMAVVRYNTDGSLDASFDEDGWLKLDFYGMRSANNSLLIQPNGKLIVVGNVHFCDENDFALARLTPDGNLDRSFEDDGLLLSYIVDISDFGNVLVQQPDGKLIVGGKVYNSSDEDFLIARYK